MHMYIVHTHVHVHVYTLAVSRGMGWPAAFFIISCFAVALESEVKIHVNVYAPCVFHVNFAVDIYISSAFIVALLPQPCRSLLYS